MITERHFKEGLIFPIAPCCYEAYQSDLGLTKLPDVLAKERDAPFIKTGYTRDGVIYDHEDFCLIIIRERSDEKS